MKKNIPFVKMVAAGNDFLVVDARRSVAAHRATWRAVSRVLCDRHQGVGADGLLLLEPSRVADVRMRVFNPDGSEAEMCGNGARCIAVYVARHRPRPVTIQTKAGVVSATVRGERVALRMVDPTHLCLDMALRVNGHTRHVACVNTGVPHAVVAVENVDAVPVADWGRALRHHAAFRPRGTNVNFVQQDQRHANRLRVRTYERGVEQETLACGTGLVASAIVCALRRYERRHMHAMAAAHGRASWKLDVQPRSGDLLGVSFTVRTHEGQLRISDVILEGAARTVFEGTVDWPPRRGV